MDLLTLLTACSLAVDPKLMHALVWHQSGGEPWAISAQGDRSPHVYRNIRDVISDAQAMSPYSTSRIGLAGIPMSPSKVSARDLWPCRNVGMAATQLAAFAQRCKTHPPSRVDPNLCAVAVYRASWERPDIKFATEVMATTAKGDAPNFDMPRDTNMSIFDIADDIRSPPESSTVDITAAFADQERGWSSALFPLKFNAAEPEPKRNATVTSPAIEQVQEGSSKASVSERKASEHELFVRRSATESAR